MNAEQQNEQGRHQRTAADPGHTDQCADDKAGNRKQRIKGRKQAHASLATIDEAKDRRTAAARHGLDPQTAIGQSLRDKDADVSPEAPKKKTRKG
jgi:hypothetical protein